MVSSVVNDMRDKILANQVTAENAEGFCFGEVDEYLATFEGATRRMREKFDTNR